MMDKYGEIGDLWFSDRFVGGYDHKAKDYYIMDKYVDAKYYRSGSNYHMALLTLLNDRQGYINFILDTIQSKIDNTGNNEQYRCLYRKLLEEIKHNELWEYE